MPEVGQEVDGAETRALYERYRLILQAQEYICIDTVICTMHAREVNYFVHFGQKMPLYKRGEGCAYNGRTYLADPGTCPERKCQIPTQTSLLWSVSQSRGELCCYCRENHSFQRQYINALYKSLESPDNNAQIHRSVLTIYCCLYATAGCDSTLDCYLWYSWKTSKCVQSIGWRSGIGGAAG